MHAAEPVDAVRFRSSYAKAAREIQDAYRGFAYSEATQSPSSSGRAQHTRTVMNRGKCFRIDFTVGEGTHASSVVCSGKAFEVIEATPLSPTNEHDTREKEFVFLSRDPRSPEQVKQLICRAELFSAPTYFFTDTIEAFVNSKAFRFTGAERGNVAAGAVLKLYWNCPIALANGTSRPRSGYFVFRDDATWLPLEYGIAFGNTTRKPMRQVIHYDAMLHAQPFASRIEKFHAGSDTPWETVELVNLDSETPSKELFDPLAFGLHDETTGRAWFWLITVFVCCFVAMLVRRLIRRS